jgi:HptB-dependent secretion and biofilm anti anti-sigma factor
MDVTRLVTETVFEARLSNSLTFSDNGSFRKLLDEMVASTKTSWVIDLSNLVTVDSAGLGMFIIAQETARKSGRALALRSPAGHVKHLLYLAKMDKLIDIQE